MDTTLAVAQQLLGQLYNLNYPGVFLTPAPHSSNGDQMLLNYNVFVTGDSTFGLNTSKYLPLPEQYRLCVYHTDANDNWLVTMSLTVEESYVALGQLVVHILDELDKYLPTNAWKLLSMYLSVAFGINAMCDRQMHNHTNSVELLYTHLDGGLTYSPDYIRKALLDSFNSIEAVSWNKSDSGMLITVVVQHDKINDLIRQISEYKVEEEIEEPDPVEDPFPSIKTDNLVEANKLRDHQNALLHLTYLFRCHVFKHQHHALTIAPDDALQILIHFSPADVQKFDIAKIPEFLNFNSIFVREYQSDISWSAEYRPKYHGVVMTSNVSIHQLLEWVAHTLH